MVKFYVMRYLSWIMMFGLIVAIIAFIVLGTAPLISLPSSIIAVLVAVTIMIVGYIEGLSLTYFIRRFLCQREWNIGRRMKLVCAIGLVLVSLLGLAIFTWLSLIVSKNVLHAFGMGLVIGVGGGAVASVRSVMKL